MDEVTALMAFLLYLFLGLVTLMLSSHMTLPEALSIIGISLSFALAVRWGEKNAGNSR